MELMLPYMVSIISALISGAASYLSATKKSRTDMQALKESNEHEIARLMKQHELDLENMERAHHLDLEKLQIEHQLQLESASSSAQTQIAGSVFAGLIASMMESPVVKEKLEQSIKDGFGKNCS